MKDQELDKIFGEVRSLSEDKQRYIKNIVEAFAQSIKIERADDSDLITPDFATEFGTILQAHHGNSARALTKEHFERAFERAMCHTGKKAELAPKGNPGHDVSVDGARFSLKTQGDKSIKTDTIWISKFMELGKGEWLDKESQLEGLRAQFLRHLQNYDRIVTLRVFCKKEGGKFNWIYELVEIPTAVLRQAENGQLKMMHDSTQRPKPGYCTVVDNKGVLLFQLYFDGGGERKLQIKALRKNLCKVHCTWSFSVPA